MERRKRRWWTRAITWVSTLVVAAAVISGLFQLAVSAVPGYRDELAAKVSVALGRPVRIGDVHLAWRWLWPMLDLSDVSLLAADQKTPLLTAERLRLGFALDDLLHGRLTPAQVDLAGMVLELELDAAGQLHLRGFTGGNPPKLSQVLTELKRFSRLRVERVAVTLNDTRAPNLPLSAQVGRADLRITDGGFELRAELQAPHLLAEQIKLRAGFAGALENPESWQGQWTLAADKLLLGPALAVRLAGHPRFAFENARLNAAGDWQLGRLGESSLEFKATHLALAATTPLSGKDLELRLAYQPQADGGAVALKSLKLTGARGVWPTSHGRMGWRRGTDGVNFEGGADFLRLDDLAPWLGLLKPILDAEKIAALTSLKGDVHGLELRYLSAGADTPPRYAVRAALSQFAFGGGSHPGLSGVAGELSGDENAGRLLLTGEHSRLTLPAAFPDPLPLDSVSADLSWTHEDGGWRLRAPKFVLKTLGAEANGELDLRLPPEAGPLLKLDARFNVADATRLKPLMPLHWGEPLKQWLTRSVVHARIANAHLVIDGPIADFPYHQNPTGNWLLDLPIVDARLDYQRAWPGAEDLYALLKFRGNGLNFVAERAQISGVRILGAKGSIEDFSQSPLVIDGQTQGDAARYYDFLRGSPLAERLAGLVGHTEAEGLANVDVHLQIPLHSDLGQHTVASGTVQLPGNTLHYSGLDEPIRAVRGALSFGGGKGIAAQGLTAQLYDTALTADIVTNADGNDELQAGFNVDYGAAHGLAARFVPSWVLDHLDGHSDWHLGLPLAGAQAGHLHLASDLRGARSRLPMPLQKAADEALPLKLEIFGDNRVPLRVQVDAPGRVGVDLRFARVQGELLTRGVGVRLGGGVVAAPDEDGIVLLGHAEQLEPAAWIALLGISGNGNGNGDGSTVAALPFRSADISAGHLYLGPIEMPDVGLSASRASDGAWKLVLDSIGSAGELSLSGDGQRATGRLSRLALVVPPAEPSVATITPTTAAVLDPNQLPTLELTVDALNIGGVAFGQLQLASERVPGGQHLSTLKLTGGVATLDLSGDWRRSAVGSSAQAHFQIDSRDVATSLHGLGFAPTLSGRSSRFIGDLAWPASPHGLEWSRARGSVVVEVDKGSLRAVEPGGTSRVLGLLNFYALPRRLLFDFRDVLSKGLGFDRIRGQFALADGDAHTDDLYINGPSLRMEVRGRIGLTAHDYDQTVTVYPDVSGVTFGALLLGGASLATGPILPLLAVIANQVLDKPIGQATQITYRLTGSWDNPEIKRAAETPSADQPAKPETSANPP